MERGDYTGIEEKVISAGIESVIVKEKHIKSNSGKEYIVTNKLGSGGQASVFNAKRLQDKHECVFKEYIPTPETVQKYALIKANMINLWRNPINEAFVTPIDVVELPVSKHFAYFMEKVDTKKYINVRKVLNPQNYPDAYILCQICKNVAEAYKTLHLGRGWCYKDLNEDNIYANLSDGTIRFIDNDNISVPTKRCIIGTDCYIAPEVYDTHAPDASSDLYSMAVLFFRYFVGSYPMDGPWTEMYMVEHELTIDEASKVIYGKNCSFAYDPRNKNNNVFLYKKNKDLDKFKKLRNSQIYQKVDAFVFYWNILPKSIKNCFIKTFSIGCHDKSKRTKEFEWIKVFDDVQKNHLVKCPNCKKRNFDTVKKCVYCKKEIPTQNRTNISVQNKVNKQTQNRTNVPVQNKVNKQTQNRTNVPVQNKANKQTQNRTNVPAQNRANAPAQNQEYCVSLAARRNVAPNIQKFRVGCDRIIMAKRLHPQFPERPLLKLVYSAEKNIYAIQNLTQGNWTIETNKGTEICRPGQGVRLEVGYKIKIHPCLELTIEEFGVR